MRFGSGFGSEGGAHLYAARATPARRRATALPPVPPRTVGCSGRPAAPGR
ncbi:hypothetical protein ACFPRL_04270 [Pseudoclavibacter helvolus]